MTAAKAYYTARTAKKRIPELETIIMQDAAYAMSYAQDVIQGRWLEAEPYIMQNVSYAYFYARNVIKRRWLEAEPYIMQDAEYAWLYARDVIQDRWLEAEPYIMHDACRACFYADQVIKGRWFEAEENIVTSSLTNTYLLLFFSNEPAVTKNQVDIIQWERKNLQGYFAPASLFKNKVSLLDMMVEE